MVRVLCKTCGAEILSATAEGKQGLCGRCAKGHRPCIYCGQHVSEPLPGGIHAHVECSIRNRQAEESLGWQSVEDIDWAVIQQLLAKALTRLFRTVARESQRAGEVTLLLCVHVEDFIEIVAYEVERDGSSKRLSALDPEWDRDLSPLDSSFSVLCERLSEQEVLGAGESVSRSSTSILADGCNELAKQLLFSKPCSRLLEYQERLTKQGQL
jgi:hypothetical protein